MIAVITEFAILFGISYAVQAVVHWFKHPVASAEELRRKRIKSSILFAVAVFAMTQFLEAYNMGLLR